MDPVAERGPRAAGTPVRISVVIASYNAAETIGRCLRSLERQDLDRELYEVIVVDSSEDGTGVLIEQEFPGVTVLGCGLTWLMQEVPLRSSTK